MANEEIEAYRDKISLYASLITNEELLRKIQIFVFSCFLKEAQRKTD